MLVGANYQIDFEIKRVASPKKVALLLHGYLQTGQYIFKKLSDLFDEETVVLAPNGPFPIPYPDPMKPKMLAYSWYFYHMEADYFLIPYSIPAEVILSLLKQLELEKLPLDIIGFSQGGFLAPHIGKLHSMTKKVIGIGANFKTLEGESRFLFKMYAIHGDQDDHVELERVQKNYLLMKERKFDYELIVKKGLGHFILDDVKDDILKIINV
jgi:predicted esterase